MCFVTVACWLLRPCVWASESGVCVCVCVCVFLCVCARMCACVCTRLIPLLALATCTYQDEPMVA